MDNEDVNDKAVVAKFEKGIATVELQRGGGCKNCSMRGFCFSKSTPAVFHLPSDLDLKPGDEVELMISPEGRVAASLLIFGLPVVSMIIGFILASFFMSELGSIVFAFALMALSFLVVRYCDKKWGNKVKIEIVRKL
nr:sigma-E factor negative regulatory protein RseC [Candidatus Cloacimonadota bacterium]